MGKWDRRYYARPRRHNNYRDYDWTPPRDEPCPDPETEDWQDNVPMWEKKFCYLVGQMPWKKVLSTKNYMHGQSNVLTWDDSAGEEAFNIAKKKFWEEFNGLPCETQLSNPDMYIDEINWNPSIDPELVREADRAYFNPDDKYYLPSASSSRGNNNGGPEDSCDPWERCSRQIHTVNDHAAVRNPWEDSVNNKTKLPKNNDPWESLPAHENEVKVNSWGGAWNNSWDSKQNNLSDPSNKWQAESNTWRSKGMGWQDPGSCSRNWNHNRGESFKSNHLNNNHKAWEFGCHQESRVPGGRGNLWGQPRRDSYDWEGKDSGNIHRGQEWREAGCRKRDGSDHHATNYKSPRLQGGDYQSPGHWNANNNRRVSFGRQWS